jgi:hypothetical protein
MIWSSHECVRKLICNEDIEDRRQAGMHGA